MSVNRAMARYPHGFNRGLTVREVPIINAHSKNVLWVDSNGAANGDGSFQRPYSSFENATNKASAGDMIVGKEGHAEVISAAASLVCDINGVSYIGLGNSRRRPTFTFTATASDIDVTGTDVTFSNLYFDVTGVDAVVGAIDPSASDFTIENCEILMADACGQCTRFLITTSDCNRMRFVNNVVRSPNAGAASVINIVGTPDGIEIAGNKITGDFSVGCLENAACNIATNMEIAHNILQNDQNAAEVIDFDSAVTGWCHHNLFITDAIATAADLGSMLSWENQFADDGVADATATPYPETVTTGGHSLAQINAALGGEADAAATGAVTATDTLVSYVKQLVTQNGIELDTDTLGDILYGTSGIATFPSAAAAANGVSLAAALRHMSERQSSRFASKAISNAAISLTTGASPVTLFTVTGDVLARVYAVIPTAITSTLNNGTLAIGVLGATAALLAATTADGTNFPDNSVWAGDTSPTVACEALSAIALTWALMTNGADIIATIATNSMTAGAITFYCEYIPLSSGGAVVAA